MHHIPHHTKTMINCYRAIIPPVVTFQPCWVSSNDDRCHHTARPERSRRRNHQEPAPTTVPASADRLWVGVFGPQRLGTARLTPGLGDVWSDTTAWPFGKCEDGRAKAHAICINIHIHTVYHCNVALRKSKYIFFCKSMPLHGIVIYLYASDACR